MKLILSDSIREKFPELQIGLLIATNINNNGKNKDLDKLREYQEKEFASKHSIESILSSNYIQAWREAYRSFGINPKKKKPTAEALLNRLIKKKCLPTISKFVDSYLIIETKYFLPIGGYDLSKISGDIQLKYSPGNESFLAIGSNEEEMTEKGEIVYSDSSRILTRRWNYKDCDYAKITEETKQAILLSEIPFSICENDTNYLLESLTSLSNLLKQFCDSRVEIGVIDNTMNSWNWEGC